MAKKHTSKFGRWCEKTLARNDTKRAEINSSIFPKTGDIGGTRAKIPTPSPSISDRTASQ
jgi:hypothetical protein